MNAPMSAHMSLKHENKQTINIVQHNFEVDKNTTLLLWFCMCSWACICHQNMRAHATETWKQVHINIEFNTFWSRQKHRSTCLVSLYPAFPGTGAYGLTIGWQWSVVTSFTDWFCVEPWPHHHHMMSWDQVSMPLSRAQHKHRAGLVSVHIRTGGKQRGMSG